MARRNKQKAEKPLPKSDEIDWAPVSGVDQDLIQVFLDPGESLLADPGAMIAISDQIDFASELGGTKGVLSKLRRAVSRKVGGEKAWQARFTSTGALKGGRKAWITLGKPYPGDVVPIDMKSVGGALYAQRGAFLAGASGTQVGMGFTRKLTAGLLGGEGFVLQRVRGDGLVFLHAGGGVQAIMLNDETIKVDTSCLVGFQDGIDYEISRAGNLRTMFFGGEGFFLVKLTGTGWVWVQSMPIDELAKTLKSALPDMRKVAKKQQNQGQRRR